MAQRAESLNAEPTRPRLAPVPPLIENPPRQSNLANIRETAARTYRSTQARARDSYSLAITKSSALVSNVGRKFQRARHERPMQIVALAAGTGLILGVVLRVWRSTNK